MAKRILKAPGIVDLDEAVAGQATIPGRDLLTANRTYYVRTDGSNSNNGLANTSGGAWLTLQYAYDYICNNIDLGKYTATVQVGAGTYTAGLFIYKSAVGGPSASSSGIKFLGDTTTPSNVVISTTGSCITCSYSGNVDVAGFKLISSTSDGLYASAGGRIYVSGKMEFGTCGGYHMHSNVNGVVVVAASSYLISGGAVIHYYPEKQSTIEVAATAVTISGTPTFSYAFAAAKSGYLIHTGCTFTGAVTGARYGAIYGGVIDSGGGGASYFPGSSPGSSSGGYYI